MNVDELIRRAKDAIANAEAVTKYVTVGGEMVGVRFTPLPGHEWRDLKARHLPRDGSFFDQNLGFNIDAVVRDYPRMSVVSGDEVDDLLRPDGGGKSRYIWPDVFDTLEDPAIEVLAQSLWEVHQFDPQQRMIAAGKALRGEKKPSSPSNSE